MEAIKTTEVLGASALEETRALRQLIASANTRIEELETAALEDAKQFAFEQNGVLMKGVLRNDFVKQDAARANERLDNLARRYKK